jgi:hypothetical protein
MRAQTAPGLRVIAKSAASEIDAPAHKRFLKAVLTDQYQLASAIQAAVAGGISGLVYVGTAVGALLALMSFFFAFGSLETNLGQVLLEGAPIILPIAALYYTQDFFKCAIRQASDSKERSATSFYFTITMVVMVVVSAAMTMCIPESMEYTPLYITIKSAAVFVNNTKDVLALGATEGIKMLAGG